MTAAAPETGRGGFFLEQGGRVSGVCGVYRSDDNGATWSRFNDDARQFGGIGAMAADWNSYGRIHVP
ncbi:hypothetical protein [Pseudoduganella namucuonensis]|uniref:Exo-alpha-sialidase n=1 Tax=Pseudoduganella namucuonensis TaxID=1035707 RepID=A0A1I7F681_9BURK|nr:hypothetical protein [Pseudoduganella namucuonensis]SFU31625.1 hypothetical protein SAMN05216552_1001401 [Pseudoduganella namucuonensis]